MHAADSNLLDSLARMDALREVVGSLPRAKLHEINAADHDFRVPKRTGRTRLEVTTEVASTIVTFLDALAPVVFRS